jgi:ribose transport system ATP-binding protein
MSAASLGILSGTRDAAAAVSAEPIVLAAERVTKSFAGVTALKHVDFALRPGEVHALVGENGAGKSTLVKILAGVHGDYDGRILLDGQEVRFGNVRDAQRGGIAIIHQELNLVPGLAVADNIFLGREPLIGGLAVDRRAAARAARKLLERLGIDLDPDAQVGRLRVGEQQLVEIAKALSLSARILIMDEPTSALSPSECRMLFRVIRQLGSAGVAIVFISHRIDEVMLIASRVTILRDGQRVLTAPIAELSRDQIIRSMVGRDALGAPPDSRAPSKDIVLAVENLSLEVPTRRGWRQVLKGVSFAVRGGEVFGIGGLLGSGRTEILETIFGHANGRHGGRVLLDGQPVTIANPRDARRYGLALLTEDRKATGLHLLSSICENIALPSLARIARFGFRGFAGEAEIATRAVHDLSIHSTGIEQPAGTLSGGNQQKVVIGKWLATAPRVLLLDEPTRGIDVGAKQEIYQLIFDLAARGLAIVVVTSELPELLLLSDRILVMCEGRPTGILSRDQASEEAVMRLAAQTSRLDEQRANA